MRLLRRRTRPHTRAIRPAEQYLSAGAGEARRLGHNYVGTEHVLLALTRNPQGGATRVLS
jgi:ATP-dependent Clp protease ATP-binding subunit ClpA